MRASVLDISPASDGDAPSDRRASLNAVVDRLEAGAFVTGRSTVFIASLTDRRANEPGLWLVDSAGTAHDVDWYGTLSAVWLCCTGAVSMGGMGFDSDLRARGADQAQTTRGVAYAIDVRDGSRSLGRGTVTVGIADLDDGRRMLTVRPDLDGVTRNERLDVRLIRKLFEFAALAEADDMSIEQPDMQLAAVLDTVGFNRSSDSFSVDVASYDLALLSESQFQVVAPPPDRSLVSEPPRAITPVVHPFAAAMAAATTASLRPGSPARHLVIAPEIATHYDADDIESNFTFGV